jgi:hypothetical protein
LKALFATLFCFALGGCLGYHIGPVKPYYLRDVHSIAVPTFKNRTLVPRIEVLVTDTVIKQLQAPARSVRGNVLATTEFSLWLVVRYSLTGRDGKQLVPPNDAIGTTTFFVSSDVTSDERQALPLATEDLATRLVTQISEGW